MSQNLQNFVKFQRIQLENLVDFEKCCKTHIFLQKSVPIQPKTNNILPKFAEIATLTEELRAATRASRTSPSPTRSARRRYALQSRGGLGVRGLGLAKLAKFCKFLAGSFSAVSKRNFARKYAFDSISQALQDLHTFAPLQSQNFRKKSV